MKGLLLARRFYFECVQPLIAAQIPELQESYAAGLIGYGSDVLGNDDELSRDHEWGPRLVLFLDETAYPQFAGKLDAVLTDALPATFAGFPTRFQRNEEIWGTLVMSETGAGKHHVAITTPQRFLEQTIGYRNGPQRDEQWLLVPEQRLLELTGGEIFWDGTGEVSQLRKQLAYFPDPVWQYRLAYAFESLGWDLDLIPLCAKRGDLLSMHLNAAASVARVMKLAFLLNRRYCPGYPKWLHREFKKLPVAAGEIEDRLHEVFVSREADAILSSLEQALAIIYSHLRRLNMLPELPDEIPKGFHRGAQVMEPQKIARLILASIEGPLRRLMIQDAPYGAADQWVTNQDMLLSPEHIKGLTHIYHVETG
jgi:hypothetical protein